MKKQKIITLVIILLVIAISVYALNKNGNTDEKTAKCIASKSVLYVKAGCFACQKQEDVFGENYEFLNVIDCSIDTQKCIDAGITATPTWIINGEKFTGYHSIENLKTVTGC